MIGFSEQLRWGTRSLFDLFLDLDDVSWLLHLVLEEKLALDLRVS